MAKEDPFKCKVLEEKLKATNDDIKQLTELGEKAEVDASTNYDEGNNALGNDLISSSFEYYNKANNSQNKRNSIKKKMEKLGCK